MKKATKYFFCVLFSLLLLVPITISVNAKEQTPLSVWVASDIHYKPQSALNPIEQQNPLPGDPLFHHVNGKGMLLYEADAIMNEILTRFKKSSAKYLLLTGDLSENGSLDQHLGIAKILKEFKEKTGKKIFVIPGNHDISKSNLDNHIDLTDFLSIYADFGYNEALVKHKGSASYTAELDSGYRLIAIDACIYDEDGSVMSPNLLAWIETQVLQAKQDGKKLVGMIHHSVLEHFGIQSVAGSLLCLENYRGNATKFADWGIKYFFTGHEHANDITMAVSQKGNRIYDMETGGLTTYPNAYRVVDFAADAVKVQTGYIDSIDTSFLPAGFNKAQLDLIKDDFPAYSLGYFKASLRSVAYDMAYSTRSIAGSLKIKEGTKGYETLSAIMGIVGDALKLPLYDKKGT
ncbi:MAG: metallophosphoesterase, partial [Eubacteriales bacterium]